MPIWAIRPLQECQRSVLFVGTIGPGSRLAAGPDGVVPGPVFCVFCGAPAVGAGEVQAVTVSSAAVSTAAPPSTALESRLRLRLRLRSRLRSRRGIDMHP